MITVPVKRMINTIREALILDHGAAALTVYRIAQALGVTVEDLLDLDQN